MLATKPKKSKEQKAIDRICSIRPWFPAQESFLRDPSDRCFQIAASQSGKTEVAVVKFLLRIINTQARLRREKGRRVESSYWIVVPTNELTIPVKRKLKKYLPPSSGLIDRAKQGRSRAFWSTKKGQNPGEVFLKNGATISFKSFAQGENLVADTVEGIWVDECARCDDVDIWGNLFARLKETKGWMIGTSSPAKRSGFYTEIYKRNKDNPDFSWLKWTSYDSARSPYSNITVADVERDRARYPAHLFAREHLAEWASAEGQIYPGFTYEGNVVKELPFCHEPIFFVGVDVGFAHPTAIEIVRFDGSEFVVTKEHTLEDTTPSEIVNTLSKIYLEFKPQYIYYDYGGGGAFLNQSWSKFWTDAEQGKRGRECQLVARDARRCLHKAWKRVEDGIQMIAGGFGGKAIKVADGCKRLIDEIDDYVWSDDPSEDKPVKENDDHVDALRYAIATYAVQKLSGRKKEDFFGVAA